MGVACLAQAWMVYMVDTMKETHTLVCVTVYFLWLVSFWQQIVSEIWLFSGEVCMNECTSSDSITFLRSLQAVCFPSQMLPLPVSFFLPLFMNVFPDGIEELLDTGGLCTFEMKFSVLFSSYIHTALIYHLLTALFYFLEQECPAALFFKLCICILSIYNLQRNLHVCDFNNSVHNPVFCAEVWAKNNILHICCVCPMALSSEGMQSCPSQITLNPGTAINMCLLLFRYANVCAFVCFSALVS